MDTDCERRLSNLSISEKRADGGGVSGTEKENATSSGVDLTRVVTEYLRGIHEEYLIKLELSSEYDPSQFEVSPQLMRCVFELTWSPDVFKASRPVLMRLYQSLDLKLGTEPGQCDLVNLLTHFHVEAMSTKFTQLVLGIAMVDPELVSRDLGILEMLIEDDKIARYGAAQEAYRFLFDTLKILYETLSGLDCSWRQKAVPDFEGLSKESKCIVKALKVLFVGVFKVRVRERFLLMKEVQRDDPGSIEWALYLSQILRMKRREVTGGQSKRPTPEEMEMLNLTLKMEPKNPFVRLNLIDSVIDSVREANGRFQCGDIINLRDMTDAMKFLQDECRSLCEEYKKNVHILSTISDYFVRYVPFAFFDRDFSKRLLDKAYKLNPKNSKTTHRLSILHRMNFKDINMSLEWLEKTLTMDAGFFNANMDYFRTLLGKEKDHSTLARKMKQRMEREEALAWWDTQLAEFKFYIGLAHFAANEKSETLRLWKQVLPVKEVIFNLADVDSDCGFFCWNEKVLSAEKIRQWVSDEHDKMKSLGAEGDPSYDEKTKNALERMLHLMLGFVNPLKSKYPSGPYDIDFEYAMDVGTVNSIKSYKTG